MRSIWVTFSKEGIHKYPAALEDPKSSNRRLSMTLVFRLRT